MMQQHHIGHGQPGNPLQLQPGHHILNLSPNPPLRSGGGQLLQLQQGQFIQQDHHQLLANDHILNLSLNPRLCGGGGQDHHQLQLHHMLPQGFTHLRNQVVQGTKDKDIPMTHIITDGHLLSMAII